MSLKLLASGYIIKMDALLDALAVDPEDLSFDRGNRPLDFYAPLDACTCLVTYDAETSNIRLAHYTVKEYLTAGRLNGSSPKVFHMTDQSIQNLAATCFIVYMLQEDYDREDKPLIEAARNSGNGAGENWINAIHIAKHQGQDSRLTPLILKLFDPTRPRFQQWTEEMKMKDADWSRRWHFPTFYADHGAECAVTLAYLCWANLIEEAEVFFESLTPDALFGKHITGLDYIESIKDKPADQWPEIVARMETNLNQISDGAENVSLLMPLLHIAAFWHRLEFIEFFLSKGADLNAVSLTGYNILATVTSTFFAPTRLNQRPSRAKRFVIVTAIVEFLLAKGVDTRATNVAVNPLQTTIIEASRQRDYSSWYQPNFPLLVKNLVEAGFDINGVADDKTNQQRLRHSCHQFFERQNFPESFDREEVIERVLRNRGRSYLYDTPLRILLDKWKVRKITEYDEHIENFESALNILEKHGAKSLHLFPVKELPGYVEEDMKEWTSTQPQKSTGVISFEMPADPSKEAQLEIKALLKSTQLDERDGPERVSQPLELSESGVGLESVGI